MQKMPGSLWILFAMVVVLATATPVRAAVSVIDFEGLADNEVVTEQFAGQNVHFSAPLAGQTTAVQAGLSLNEVEFPPHSGVTVVLSDIGTIEVVFDALQASVAGFFNHASSITLTAFGALDDVVDTETSSGQNDGLGGTPNVFIETSAATGIRRLTIVGPSDAFTLDDLTFSPLPPPPGTVPEPEIELIGFFLFALALRRACCSPATRPQLTA